MQIPLAGSFCMAFCYPEWALEGVAHSSAVLVFAVVRQCAFQGPDLNL